MCFHYNKCFTTSKISLWVGLTTCSSLSVHTVQHWTGAYWIWHYAEASITTLSDKWLICLTKLSFFVQRHAIRFVQVYANPFIGERIMNINKWKIWSNVHCRVSMRAIFDLDLVFVLKPCVEFEPNLELFAFSPLAQP